MWIARDEDNTLHVFISKPIRKTSETGLQYWQDNYTPTTVSEEDLINFDKLEWEDDPITVLEISFWTVRHCGVVFMPYLKTKYKIYVDSKEQ